MDKFLKTSIYILVSLALICEISAAIFGVAGLSSLNYDPLTSLRAFILDTPIKSHIVNEFRANDGFAISFLLHFAAKWLFSVSFLSVLSLIAHRLSKNACLNEEYSVRFKEIMTKVIGAILILVLVVYIIIGFVK